MKISDEIVEIAAQACYAELLAGAGAQGVLDNAAPEVRRVWRRVGRAVLESVAERIMADAEAPTADPWRETVRDIYDELHFGKISLFTGSKLAKRLIGIIEDRHPGYFNEPPPDRDSARDRRPA